MDNLYVQVSAVTIGMVTFLKALDWLYEKFVKPKSDLETRLKTIETQIKEVNAKLDRDFKELTNHDGRISILEVGTSKVMKGIDKTNALLLMSIKVNKELLKHGIDGNNIDGLKKVGKEVDEYLINQIAD